MEKNNRWVTLDGLMEHTTLKRTSAEKLAKEAEAKRKYGRRSLYDLQKIDAFLEKQEV